MVDILSNLQIYCLLKDEILYYIKAQDTIVTITITATIALLSLAIEQNASWLALITSIFVALMYATTVSFQNSILKISGYMQVFLEPTISISWEKDVKGLKDYMNDNNIEFPDNNFNKLKKNIFSALELFCLVVCIILHANLLIELLDYIFSHNLLDLFSPNFHLSLDVIWMSTQIIIIAIIGYKVHHRLKIKGTYPSDKRNDYINIWEGYNSQRTGKSEKEEIINETH